MKNAYDNIRGRKPSAEELARRSEARRRNAEDRFMKTLAQFSVLPDEAHVDSKIARAILNCSQSTLWRGVRTRKLTPPVATGKWTVGAIRNAAKGNANGQ